MLGGRRGRKRERGWSGGERDVGEIESERAYTFERKREWGREKV